MIIPSGWIHAVYTPSDSLVLGGNFLTPLHIPSQLQIANIETRTRVPKKFRFPFFDLAMWYTAQYYLDRPREGEMSTYELAGVKELAEWAWKKAKLRGQQMAKGPDYHRAKVEVPPAWDVADLATRFVRWVYESDDGTVDPETPTWVKNEVLGIKNETSSSPARKRKRDEGETPTPRKYTRRTSKRGEQITNGDVVMTDAIPLQEHRTIEYVNLSRPVTSYSSISSVSTTQYPNINYPLQLSALTTMSSGPPLKIFKPYAPHCINLLLPKGPSFLDIIKSTYRPYVPNLIHVLEEIKVEDEPQLYSTQVGTGLDVLSLAIDLQTQLPDNPASPASTLTVYSPSDSRVRLPTPPSQSPPPAGSREAALELRSRSNSPTPVVGKKRRVSSGRRGKKGGAEPIVMATGRTGGDEVEARRLEGLFSVEEMIELRKRRRRASGYLFSVTSLKKELDRMGRAY